MFPHPLLIADIGGTNARFALFDHPGAEPQMLARLKTADFATPALAIKAVLADLPEAPRSAILCVAGPVVDRRCHLTNAAWTIDGPALVHELGFEQGLLLNDFEAQALSLPAHRDIWLTQIGTLGRSSQSGPRVILGPGTGVVISILVPSRRMNSPSGVIWNAFMVASQQNQSCRDRASCASTARALQNAANMRQKSTAPKS